MSHYSIKVWDDYSVNQNMRQWVIQLVNVWDNLYDYGSPIVWYTVYNMEMYQLVQ